MSGWMLDGGDEPGAGARAGASASSSASGRGNNHTTASSSTGGRGGKKAAFFAEDDEITEAAALAPSDHGRVRRDSLTLSSTRRRAQRGGKMELLVVDDDDHDDDDDGVPEEPAERPSAPSIKSLATKSSVPVHGRLVMSIDGGNGKSDELVIPDVVIRPVAAPTSQASPSPSMTPTTLREQYMQGLVREFLVRNYPPSVVALFDTERGSPTPWDETCESHHTRLLGSDGLRVQAPTRLEQCLVSWDATTHNAKLTRPPSRSRSTRRNETSDVSPVQAEAVGPENSSSTTPKPRTSGKSGGRKKPNLSVTINADESNVVSSDDHASRSVDASSSPSGTLDFNRLDHPGHTPKAHNAAITAVIGAPGSTPRASSAELQALGFEDVDDDNAAVPSENQPSEDQRLLDPDDAELSLYAQRKRAAQRHTKHVYIGEPGSTPTKEYVFFRETPPRFVTETVEDAEHALREIGGEPRRQQHIAVSHLDRFVELQSSEVSKYKIGQSVENLGVQRNISGLISKLYGSRQCGSAGPGTIVIDTWNGSDTAPNCGDVSANHEGDTDVLIDQLLMT